MPLETCDDRRRRGSCVFTCATRALFRIAAEQRCFARFKIVLMSNGDRSVDCDGDRRYNRALSASSRYRYKSSNFGGWRFCDRGCLQILRADRDAMCMRYSL